MKCHLSRRIQAVSRLILFTATAAMIPLRGQAPVALDLNRVRAEMAPTGPLRAAINHANPLLATRDPQTGELRGVAVDLSRELGRRLGLAVELVPFDAAGRMSGAVRDNVWDVAYLAIDPERAQEIDYTEAYIEIEGTYLVPAGSPLRTIDEVDREGVRIAVTSKSGYDLFLTRNIKRAQLVHAPTTPESIALFRDQKLEAVAAVRTSLVAAALQIPGSRVMNGRFMTIPQAAGIPKGRPNAARYLREFIQSVKASGLVAEALRRHGFTADDAIVP